MDTLRTLGGFGSGKALFRAVGIKVQDPIMPDGVVAAGYLSILHASKTVANAQQRQAWKRRYFVLRSTGQLDYYKSGRYGVGTNAKGGALLSGEYFVGDSLLRPHGFQVSDFETTVYLACDTAADQIDWMFKIGTQRDTAPASTYASAPELTTPLLYTSLSLRRHRRAHVTGRLEHLMGRERQEGVRDPDPYGLGLTTRHQPTVRRWSRRHWYRLDTSRLVHESLPAKE